MGVMSYLASPLWLLFLIATGIEAYIKSLEVPVYFFGDNVLPVWPQSYTVEMMTVLLVTLAMLFLPKVLALVLLAVKPRLGRRSGVCPGRR
jgi:membrane glycosyltransferase